MAAGLVNVICRRVYGFVPARSDNAAGLVNCLRRRSNDWITQPPKRKIQHTVNKVLQPEKNAIWGGIGTIAGTLKVNTTAVRRRVRLYEASTGVLIREEWSGADGSYRFSGLKTGYRYTVTATDYEEIYNDVIAAHLTAV